MFLTANNGTYTNQPQTKQQIIEVLQKGGVNKVEFRQSRIGNFDHIIINGTAFAKAFYSQQDQINYLQKEGLI